ncbi:MAG: threonylcarbamoyl-AMP synthase [Solobacterium sp.]|nr:threonylcarbamoyl-AMP synthase [Solobacterium sp.]
MKVLQETDIDTAAQILRNDGVIAIATDTVFGVCARMDSRQAQENLRNVKHRPKDKAFPLMCCDREQIESIAYVSEEAGKLIDAFMPGPVTLVLKKKEHVPAYVNGGMDTVAVRMASSDALYRIIRATGCPVFMTSANRSGEPVCRDLQEIMTACPDLDAVVEGRPSFAKASTIIDCSGDTIRILREGPVSQEQIAQIQKEK